MNFNGRYVAFGEEGVRPKSVSFMVHVAKRCNRRAFANLFLSSSPVPYRDMAFFYLGRPPLPPDLFSTLINVQSHGPDQSVGIGYQWLPTGESLSLSAAPHPKEEAAEARPERDMDAVSDDSCDGWEWTRVRLRLDWDRLVMQVCVNDGPPSEETAFAPSMPWPGGFGFRHMYLFTWTAAESPHAGMPQSSPVVHWTDIWLEDSARPADSGADHGAPSEA